MTPEQATVMYLTCAVLTFCFLGATFRLPGQRTFRADTRAIAAAAVAARGDVTVPTRRDLMAATVQGIVHVALAVALWPLYWGFAIVHSVVATMRVNRS